jgi:hypothetical protein
MEIDLPDFPQSKKQINIASEAIRNSSILFAQDGLAFSTHH